MTFDLPVPANLATPMWLGHPVTPATTFATLEVPIMAPDPSASLLVTVYFQEKQGGFLRITWTGTLGAQVLSENFYENIGMANQRSLLIPAATLVGDGALVFQCGDSSLGIQRIKLEWLQSKDSLVSPKIQDTLVTPETGTTTPSITVNGQPQTVQPAAWQDDFVNVPLADGPVRIEEGVEFSVDLDKVPVSARISLKEAGLPLGKRFGVWINQQRAGTITPAVPDLTDGGFLPSAAGAYVGWRDGSFFVPVSLLKEGVNTVQFADEDDADSADPASATAPTNSDAPVAVKDLSVELNYAPPASPSDPPPQLLLGPVEPLAPTPASTSTPSSSP